LSAFFIRLRRRRRDAGTSPRRCWPTLAGLARTARSARWRGQQLARDGAELLGRADLLQQHDELVAAQARHHVARAQRLLEAQRRLVQQLVAGFVAERVVDELEAVEVDEHHRDLAR
jgi:hypothetical protein